MLFDEMMNFLREGDELILSEFSRLAHLLSIEKILRLEKANCLSEE